MVPLPRFIVPFLSVMSEFSRNLNAFVIVPELPTRFPVTVYVNPPKSMVTFLSVPISMPSPEASESSVIVSPSCTAATASFSVAYSVSPIFATLAFSSAKTGIAKVPNTITADIIPVKSFLNFMIYSLFHDLFYNYPTESSVNTGRTHALIMRYFTT